MRASIAVVDYDPTWPEVFRRVHSFVWPAVREIASSVEHVGSTAVPGLAAKPIVDVSVVVRRAPDVVAAIERLATLGYRHQGDLGIEGREAFESPGGWPAHNLYACASNNPALANHLALRDYLRAHPETAREYADLKKRLAAQFPRDPDGYVTGKTEFLLGVLRAAGLAPAQLAQIARVNRQPPRI